MESNTLTGQSVEAVLDRSAGELEVTAQCPEALGGDVSIEKVRVINSSFGIEIEGKGLGREGSAADAASKPRNQSKGTGQVDAERDEPIGRIHL